MTTTHVHRRVHGWHRHPGVRSDGQLTLGERAADRMRNGMGSWIFVFAALIFLGAWMSLNRDTGFDKYPFILLNLVLSCLAALQGAILLIAAKRSDQIASELAQHDYETDREAERHIERLGDNLAQMAAEQAELRRQVAELTEALRATGHINRTPDTRGAPDGEDTAGTAAQTGEAPAQRPPAS